MENASKALIIAGAILIAILLITIGIILINSGRNVTITGSNQVAAQKIQTFNSQFEPYEGTITGAQLKKLMNLVIANNAADPAHQIFFGYANTYSSFDKNHIPISKKYNCKITYATANASHAGVHKNNIPLVPPFDDPNYEYYKEQYKVETEKGYIYKILFEDPNI